MLHAITLATRIYILGRPPVATLYESVLFVALIASIIALILSFLKPRIETVLIGAVSALILLIIAPYTVKGIDDMAPVAAVLNTNLWLGIHVLCITSGYALCILTALVAHLTLLKDGFAKLALILSMIALFFVATGTVLGGIWADQSWGRFWGWDPKENGALLIVLWLTWLHHGRLGTMIPQRWFLAGLAFLNVVVALAWFGVNLLGVGLHSYGFADGLAWGLGVFCVLQTIVILALLYKNIKRVA